MEKNSSSERQKVPPVRMNRPSLLTSISNMRKMGCLYYFSQHTVPFHCRSLWIPLSLSLFLSLFRNLYLNGRPFFELRENKNLLNILRDTLPKWPEFFRSGTGTVWCGDQTGTPAGPPPWPANPWTLLERPYEASEIINIGLDFIFGRFLLRTYL